METNACMLALNAGSSGIKFSLYSASEQALCHLQGSIDWQHLPALALNISEHGSKETITRHFQAIDRSAAVQVLLDWIAEISKTNKLLAVGHRIVHGGAAHYEPEVLTSELTAQLQALGGLDPEHVPQEIMLVNAMCSRFPDIPQIACFDTAFHHALPRVAQLLPVPRKFEQLGVRRYGFHGLSYAWLMQQLALDAGAERAAGRVILAHIGSGVSLAAVKNNQVVDTTMAFTPAAGICMATRTGDIDPGLVGWFLNTAGMSVSEFNRMVNSESGLLGISETSADMKTLLATEADDIRAREAVDLFCYQIKKTIGAYAAALGGLDTLVFAGGVGENSAVIRSRICKGLAFLGLQLDEEQNSAQASVLSMPDAKVLVRMIPTDESRMIAHNVWQLLQRMQRA